MEFKKCERCGSFFFSNDNVCYNCLTKERAEITKLKSYVEENSIGNIHSINELSLQTGISGKTLDRFLDSNDFADIAEQFK